ncbi:hypothetical protein [Pedobacter cryoconitis]|uniref:Uncharacterized protein n=1 Tax=Pedobacter cryoconitis TaxID=188932 RepID=A0A327THK7_9SPHI|nr:hypothetical protein [Pedobacter cryoconitis]RAJ37327.1 hypothetical protein LY11_00403 [Pedobacter cryoconitis]
MKILKKHNTLLQYSINLLYFEKNSELKQTQYTSSHWTMGAENSLLLQYDIFFYAKNPITNECFVNYHNRFDLQCIIEDIVVDAEEVVKFKEIINVSAQLFLMQNTKDYYYLLNFNEMNLTSDNNQNPTRLSGIDLEIKSVKKAMGISPI